MPTSPAPPTIVQIVTTTEDGAMVTTVVTHPRRVNLEVKTHAEIIQPWEADWDPARNAEEQFRPGEPVLALQVWGGRYAEPVPTDG